MYRISMFIFKRHWKTEFVKTTPLKFNWEKSSHRKNDHWSSKLKHMLEQCGSSLFHGLAADSFRTSYRMESILCVCVSVCVSECVCAHMRACVCVAASCSFSPHFHLSHSAWLLWRKYIPLKSSSRRFNCYQVHTCPTKAFKWKLTITF